MLDQHDTIGFDLVGMVVDDLVVCGAEPLFMTDYIACGKLVAERIATIVHGIADACRVAGCALLGGETAEHPGLLGVDEYDLAGAATGIVDEPSLLGPARVRRGDVVLAMASSGLHANGYSLVRHVFLDAGRWSLDRPVAELGRTLGEELIAPTRIYAKDCLLMAAAVDLHALAHVTGGGIAANVARVLPTHLDAVLDRSTWSPQPIFSLVGEVGDVAQAELERTFNMGVGMVAIMASGDADRALRLLEDRGLVVWRAGEVVQGEGRASLTGRYA
jgi:phosphoribosylformylglycinamidine cyclo-ligase